MPETYEYSFGSVRAREKYLFTHADIEAMLSLNSREALVTFLRDKGYGEGETLGEILRSCRESTFGYLEKIVPDISVFDVFLYPNDAHNIKSVIKGLLSNTDYKKLFITPCTVETKTVEAAVKENNYSLLPDGFAAAAQKAYDILARTTDARKADAFIDNACMSLQLEKAKKTKIAFLVNYIETEIFYRNVKIALRASMTSSPAEYLEESLFDGVRYFNKSEVIHAATDGMEKLTDYLSHISAYSCREAMERFSVSPAEFEKFTENLLMKMTRNCCKRSSGGPEAAIGFFLARLAEEKAIHIIAVGIDTKAENSVTRERLREIYG